MNIKLSIVIANNIREDYFVNGLTRQHIAEKYNISKCTVSEITTNKIWKISSEDQIKYEKQLEEYVAPAKTHKECPKCKIDRDINQFNKKTSWCKLCLVEYRKTYSAANVEKLKKDKQEYYLENREILLDKVKKYNQENKDHKKEYDKNRLATDPEKYRKERRDYYYNNKEACIERGRKNSNIKYKNDPLFKIRSRVSCEVRRALTKLGLSKNKHSILKYLPYTLNELKEHLEQQFETWMNWSNWGKYDVKTWDDNDVSTWTWQIDHIIPQADLLYTSMEDDNFQKCWALNNLRPYSSKQNLLDGVSRVRHGGNNE
jgi:hypothetical protein